MIDWDAKVLGPSLSVFGEDPSLQPVYTPAAGGGAFPIDGVFDDAVRVTVLLDDGSPGFVTTDPMLGVRLAQFASPPLQGDKVRIPRVNSTYLVSRVNPDGHGGARLDLNFVSTP